MLSSSCEFLHAHRHAIIILWVWRTHHHLVSSACYSSCELDRHIVMLSSSCEFWHAHRHPCGKQHFREIATPDGVGQFTNLTYRWVCSHLRKVLTPSGVAISRKCCFPHGSSCYHHLVSWTNTSSSCELGMLFILWVGQTHRHAIIILWVLTCASKCYHHLVSSASSSSCELDRQITRLSSSCEFWHANRHAIHLVSWTNTSSCYHHLVSSACYHHLVSFDMHIVMLSSSCEFLHAHRHAIIILWVVTCTSACYHHAVSFDMHIVMLSSSCKFMLPKRRFWKAAQTFQNARSKHSSTFCSPNHVLTPLKSASKTGMANKKMRNFAPTT